MTWDPGFNVAFTPQSVAVLGASTKGDRSGGNGFIRGMKDMEYPGRIYPVNPKADEIMGLKCYPSLAAVPELPDLVIVAVNVRRAEAALEECIARGARNIHMFTAGFGETGEEEGDRLAERLRAIAARGNLNIVGPNCMGIYSPAGRISPWGKLPSRVGPIAFISQSGAVGGEFTRMASDVGLRMSKVISYGNGYVLDCTDYLEYLETDPDTRFIGMYLEGVRDGRKLMEMVRRIGPRKPVLVLKGGLTPAGAKAAASHTGSLAGQERIWEAFFNQSGAIRVDSVEEMTDVLQALVRLPACSGRNAALFGGAGGTSVAAADIFARAGMGVPTLTEETQRRMREFVGVAGTSVRNPLDVGMQIRGAEEFLRVLQIAAEDPLVDMLVVVTHPMWGRMPGRKLRDKTVDGIIEFAQKRASGKPVVVAMRGPSENLVTEKARLQLSAIYRDAGIPVFRSIERAASAMAAFTAYYRMREDAETADPSEALLAAGG